MIFLILTLIATPAFAYNDGNSYSAVKEIPLTPVGSQYQAKGEAVIVDRHVLNETDYRNDPTIHISKTRIKDKEVAIIVQDINPTTVEEFVNDDVKDVPVIVKSQMCDDVSCSNWEEQQ